MRKPRVPFTPEIADRIWAGLDAGRGLRRLCRHPDLAQSLTLARNLAAWNAAERQWAAWGSDK